jgi:competence protein ComEA
VQVALTTLIGSVLVWLITHSALQGSIRTLPTEESRELDPARLDLNAATVAELRLLPGVGDTLAKRIDAFRTLYGPFPNVDELRKVPGMKPALLERIRPHLVIVSAVLPAEASVKPAAEYPAPSPKQAIKARTADEKPLGLLDINHATAEELERLPGIGRKLAQRIVEARTKVAFTTIDELRRVPGIGPKTLEKVRPHVTTGP